MEWRGEREGGTEIELENEGEEGGGWGVGGNKDEDMNRGLFWMVRGTNQKTSPFKLTYGEASERSSIEVYEPFCCVQSSS